jgi:hypothetical protein
MANKIEKDLKMNREKKTKKYCELLMKFKKDGVQLVSYMGTRWIIFKVLIVVVVFLLLIQQDEVYRIAGSVFLGYLVGVVVANVRGYIVGKAGWEIQREFVDWVKVEEHLKSDE